MPAASPDGAPTPGVSNVPGDPNSAGLLPLRRLSAREYLNTLKDLLNVTGVTTTSDLPNDEGGNAFAAYPFLLPVDIGKSEAELLQAAAEAAIKSFTSRISSILPCTPNGTNDATCASQFISSFAPKAYRRPLDSTETSHLTSLYQTARTTLGLDFNGAIGVLIEAILQSPGFLYHWEKDPGAALRDGSLIQLGPYQVANRLSYFIWGSMPDATLFDAAAKNQLNTQDLVEAQARRLLADARAKDAISNFLSDLLDMDLLAFTSKDGTVSPLYQMFDDLKAPMLAEFKAFGLNVLVDGTGRFDDLLSSTTSFVNQSLAPVYGLNGVSGSMPSKVMLNSAQRGGLLTLSGFMANFGSADEANPIRRGRIVYTRLMCGVVAAPPNGVPPAAGKDSGGTARERAEAHTKNPCATGCHSKFDPFGFPFEHYSGLGDYVTTDNGAPVNSTSMVDIEGDGKLVAVTDAMDLSKKIAASGRAQACLATQFLRYLAGRLDTPADVASIQAATARFRAKSNDVRELMVALTGTRTFRYRAQSAGEVL
jgi:hypothetical protein